jgi:hypothetical protein
MLDRALVAEAKAAAGSGTARAAASKCMARVPIETTKSGSTLVTTFLKKAPATTLKVTCKKIRGGVRMTVRPRKKGKSLKSVVGSRLHVGLMRSFVAQTGNKDLTVKFKR